MVMSFPSKNTLNTLCSSWLSNSCSPLFPYRGQRVFRKGRFFRVKVVILAGGFGTRISEESHLKPKPMIPIGNRPILWHIMKRYSHFGFNEFVICAGYKQEVIKQWFSEYYIFNSNVTFDFTRKEKIIVHNTETEPWRVTVVDTGLKTMTGGRLRRVRDYLGDEPFFLTYGDGVCDIDFGKELAFHQAHGHLATMAAVHPETRFGVLDIHRDDIRAFREKNQADVGWINGGFMILDPRVIDYIDGDDTILERTPMERLAAEGQLKAYRHNGFWQCMDTMRDKEKLEYLWQSGTAPWKCWDD